MKKAILMILFLALTGGACRYFQQHANHVRRVIANPGDVVEVRDGTVFVNSVAAN